MTNQAPATSQQATITPVTEAAFEDWYRRKGYAVRSKIDARAAWQVFEECCARLAAMASRDSHSPPPSGRDFGRADLMATAAVRYCLGRKSYIVDDCVNWLRAQWSNITPNAQRVIARDIEEAIRRDDEARERGDEHLPLGMGADRAGWVSLRPLWQGGAHGASAMIQRPEAHGSAGDTQ